jgi:hypothetical protein
LFILQFWHPVKDYDEWKKVFDNDPLKRQPSGVRRHQITRPADNPNYVVGELEFDSRNTADDFLTRLRALWGNIPGNVAENPQGRILEIMESKTY